MKKQIIVSAVVALILIIVMHAVGLVGGNQSGPELGSGTRFPNGISADSTSPSAGEVRGTTLTITGAQTFSGAATFSDDLTVDSPTFFVDASEDLIGFGTTTPLMQLHVEQEGLTTNATGTIAISSASSTPTSGGRIIFEDSDGGGCTEIYAINGTLQTAALTCPVGI